MSALPIPAPATAKEWWTTMLLIRRFEERSSELYASGAVGGFLHSARGEEAVVVGAARALRPGDAVLTTFRAGAWALARGTKPSGVLAELLGLPSGASGGLGGSTHIVDPDRGLYGGFGIPAGHAPLSAGVALSFAAQSYEGIALCQLTLGATAEGIFAETLALAASWSLPVVFLVTRDLAWDGPEPAVTDLFQRSSASGVAGLKCSGVDPIEVHDRISEAARRARDERKPTLVEAVVRRSGGEAVDPVAAFGDRLMAEGAMTAEERAAINTGVGDRLDLAVAEAMAGEATARAGATSQPGEATPAGATSRAGAPSPSSEATPADATSRAGTTSPASAATPTGAASSPGEAAPSGVGDEPGEAPS
jgi:pyruvate dehydrogenase E1 component alpha subunit